MKIVMIVMAYLFAIYMFCNIKKIKNGDKKEKNYNKVYVSIVGMVVCFMTWGIMRMIEQMPK